MIGAGLLLLQAAQAVPPPPRDPVPMDWSALPPVPYISAPRMTPAYSRYVAGEIAAGRCGLIRPVDGRWSVRIDVVMLVDAAGAPRRLVPRAIGCPTVEQYAAGLAQGFARGNLALAPTTASTVPSWYRTTITFAWTA